MENQGNRELRIIRTFKAPLELVWEVWTDPQHIIHWWGPSGYTTTISEMTFEEGGEWKLTLHGPDGTNYSNRSIFREIVPLKKIVFEHFNPHFFATIIFEQKGEGTQIDWSLGFDTREMLDTVVKTFNAEQGQKENFEKLEKYLNQKINTK